MTKHHPALAFLLSFEYLERKATFDQVMKEHRDIGTSVFGHKAGSVKDPCSMQLFRPLNLERVDTLDPRVTLQGGPVAPTTS